MKKIFFLLSGIALLLSSCSSDDSDAANSDLILVKKAVSVGSNGDSGISIDYKYSGNKITWIEVGTGQKLKFYYTGNLITKSERYFSDDTNFSAEVTYQYDNEGRLIEEEYRDLFSSILETRVYNYETDGSISLLLYSGEIGSITELRRTGKYFFNDDNEVVTFENTNISTNETTTTNYTYDDQNSIFKNVLGWNKLFSSSEGKMHNIVTSTTVSEDQVVLNEYSNQYEYNSSGYPTSMTTTIGNSTSTVNYFY